MRYRLRDLPEILKTPVGRRQLISGQSTRLRPILIFLAGLYRRIFLKKVTLIVVVGSLGKTTTARAVTTGLGLPLHPKIGSNAHLQLAKALFRIRPNDRYRVLEVGVSAPGQMKKYARMIRPNKTVVTSIASEHNSSFKTLEVTREEKSEMVRIVPDDGTVFLNGDDPNVMWMAGRTKAKIVTYGIDTRNDVTASAINQNWPGGMEFIWHAAGKSGRIKSRLVGRHMVYPLLAAVAVVQDQGIDIDRAMERISRMEPTKGRMQPVVLENGAVIVRDDFKSSQETIYAALEAFSEIPARKKIVVLGELNEPMADNIYELYRDIGGNVGRIASRAIFLGHRKSCRNYLVGAKQGGLTKDSAVHMGHDVLGVARLLREELGPGDLVLLKGRMDQRLIRIVLALEGLEVACDLGVCTVSARNCRVCPMLSKKWPGLPQKRKKKA